MTLNKTNSDWLFDMSVHGRALTNESCHLFSRQSEGLATRDYLTPILKSLPHAYVHNHGNDDRGNKRRWHTSIFNQKPTLVCCVKRSKINVTHQSRNNNTTSASGSIPSHSLSSLSLESFSNIYTGPSSCLIVSLLFNILFLQYFPLFYLPFLSYL